jgi:hypothetical protein
MNRRKAFVLAEAGDYLPEDDRFGEHFGAYLHLLA